MKQDKKVEWEFHLMLPVLCFFFAVVIGGSALSYVLYDRLQEVQDEKRRTEIQYRKAQRERRESDELVRKVDEYQARYNLLKERGYFRSDAKINWLEKIGEIAEQIGIESVDYSIGSAFGENRERHGGSGLRVESMPVTLQFKMLHEIDMLRFVDQIANREMGLVSNDGCILKKTASEIQTRILNYAFEATCEMKGYVIGFGGNREA